MTASEHPAVGARVPSEEEIVSFRAWERPEPPQKILVIRLHSIGDVAITFPACASLRKLIPNARIDFLTGVRSTMLPESTTLFDNVYAVADRAPLPVRLGQTLPMGASLAKNRYDLVVDLQRNWTSRSIRRMCMPHSWSEFDRFAPRPAGEKVVEAFELAGFAGLAPSCAMPLRPEILERGRTLLAAAGWDGSTDLVCLNPAGLWKTRNWPLEGYATLASEWLHREPITFVLIGDERIAAEGDRLAREIPGRVINLIGRTSLAEAFSVAQHLALIVSEDSALMHLGWVSGVPTLALFGSSRHDWSRPLGPHTRTLHSGDLECGACMEPQCRFGDVHCLTRYSPRDVLTVAMELRQIGRQS